MRNIILAGLLTSLAGSLSAEPAFDALPDLGDTSGQVLSPQQDRALGAAFMRQIRAEDLVLEDTEITRYLNNLGRRLVIHSENPGTDFNFFMVNDPQINAFAGPGGNIGINIGLFTAAESESELAGVMAHEIAHITQRHLARAFDSAQRQSLTHTAALLAAILIGTQNTEAGVAAAQATAAASLQQQINFTRANEKEADRIGIRALAGAGLDPNGMSAFFERLQKNARLYGTRPPEFLSTHPVTSNRIAEADARAAAYPPTSKPDNPDFLLLRARLRAAGYANPAQVLTDIERYKGNNGGNEVEDRFEFALLLAKVDRYDEAIAIMRTLHAGDPDRLTYRLALGRLLSMADRTRAAIRLYRESLQLYPHEPALVQALAATHMLKNDNKKAMDILEHSYPADPASFKLLAEAAGKSGNELRRHTAMAEYYSLNGFTTQAVKQLELALDLAARDDYRAARIQARLTELKTRLETEKLE